ncbi:hypothetical protein QR680_016277 [Steinernema hermaphroditum]|uniref:Serpentine receptor class gamma n=1 Tax=Steinernema hermaphroditum TaxID=289476 RepID=A0AA39HAP0_9BILA|nr:hypothetical protein QR680_016277 [Steinernema hermaphroditum]
METFFVNRAEYDRLYNCTGIDASSVGIANLPLGLTYMIFGVLLEILYLPCMVVLWSPSIRQNSCHKIMFLLGFFDMCTIFFNSIVTGYLTIEGAVFCTHPTFIYIAGSLALGLWCCTCVASVSLGINRSIDLWFPQFMKKVFDGKRMYVWYCAPFIYGGLFTWYTRPITYSSYAYAWFFDPYYGIDGLDYDRTEYANIYHSGHNTTTVVTICSLYVFLSISVWWKCRKSHFHTQTVSLLQKQLIFQSCMMCMFILVADFIYVYMQYLPTPTWLIVVGQSTWICCHGPTLFDSIMTKYEDVFVFGRPVGEEEKELDEKLLNHSLIYKESLSEASDILQLHPQNEIIPPFVELEDKMRVVHKKKLAACVIEKNMSTVLTAILCFLEDFKVFTQANRTIATEGYYGRFCQEKNEYNSVEHMLATTHTHLNDWTMFVLVRDPLERLVSAYADKCIYHREKQIEDNCYGCRHNVTCFVSNVYSRSKAFAESSPENRTYTMEDVHVFPQNWCVSF